MRVENLAGPGTTAPPKMTPELAARMLAEHNALPPFIAEGFAVCSDCGSAMEPTAASRAFHERRCAGAVARLSK